MASCINVFSDLLIPDNTAVNKADNKVFSCFCGTIYLGRSSSASLLTYRYLRALGSICDSNSDNFFVEAVFFYFVFALGFFFKIFFLGVTSSFGSVTPKFI